LPYISPSIYSIVKGCIKPPSPNPYCAPAAHRPTMGSRKRYGLICIDHRC